VSRGCDKLLDRKQEAGRKKEGKFWNAVDMIFKNLTANLTDAPRREK
jgi:hypothetical protein